MIFSSVQLTKVVVMFLNLKTKGFSSKIIPDATCLNSIIEVGSTLNTVSEELIDESNEWNVLCLLDNHEIHSFKAKQY